MVIEEGVTSISGYAFSYLSNLTQVSIADSVQSIGSNAFLRCVLLESVTIPAGVTSIGDGAFSTCHALTGIEVDPENPVYSSAGGVVLSKDGTQVLLCPDGFTGVYTIPDTVTSIADRAFSQCSKLSGVVFPQNLTKIGIGAFDCCFALTELSFPESLTEIPQDAFNSCWGLTKVTLPVGLQSIATNAFFACSHIETLVIPASVQVIAPYAFEGCNFKEIYFQGSAPEITDCIGYGIQANAYYPAGDPTWTEEIRALCGSNITWTAYEEFPEVIEKFSLYGTSMTLGNALDMNFFVEKSYIEGTDNYAVITKHYADNLDDVTVTVPQSEWVSWNDMYYFTFRGFTAKEMKDWVDVVIYNADHQAISNVYSDSVCEYARRMLDKDPSREEKVLYVELLSYGAAAQTYFKYDRRVLATAYLTSAEQKAYSVPFREYTDISRGDEAYYASSLSLKSNIELNLFFYDDYVSSDMYAVVNYVNHYGKEKTLRIEGSEFMTTDAVPGTVYVPINCLTVADCSRPITCTIYDRQGNVVTSVKESAESYVARMDSQGDLYRAIMDFADAAYDYFHHCTDPNGHSWGNWTVTREPSQKEDGEKTRTCRTCGETEREHIRYSGIQSHLDVEALTDFALEYAEDCYHFVAFPGVTRDCLDTHVFRAETMEEAQIAAVVYIDEASETLFQLHGSNYCAIDIRIEPQKDGSFAITMYYEFE